MYPTDLKYTKDHEWVKLGANEATVGITDFAQGQLGDVVFVELPAVGRQVKQGEIFGTIESVKAVSELFSPIAGEVIAVNDELGTHPTVPCPRRSQVAPTELTASAIVTGEDGANKPTAGRGVCHRVQQEAILDEAPAADDASSVRHLYRSVSRCPPSSEPIV